MKRYAVILYCIDQHGTSVLFPAYTGTNQKRWRHKCQHFSMLYWRHQKKVTPFWWARKKRIPTMQIVGVEKRWYTNAGTPVTEWWLGERFQEAYDVQRV